LPATIIKSERLRPTDTPVTVGTPLPPPKPDEDDLIAGEFEEVFFEKEAEPDWEAMREKVLAGARLEAEELRSQADALIEQARNDMAQQDQVARTERESLTAKAFEQAKARGHAEGLESARQATQDIIDKANKAAAELAAAIEAEGEALRREAPPKILSLVLEIAQVILHKTLSDDDGAFLSMAAAAVDEAGLSRKVELRLNPEDYLRVFGGMAERHTFDTTRGQVEAALSPDPSVLPLNVRAEYPGGSIETGPDVGMEKLREALYGD
jgi:flagellar biosynthesis/type III secretory pathway protein FliH